MAGSASPGGYTVSYMIQATDQYSKVLNQFKKSMNDVEQKVVQASRRIEKGLALRTVGNNLANLGRSMSMYVTLPVLGFAAASLKAASNLEDFGTTLRIFTGSTEKSGKLLEEIRTISDNSIFSLGEYAKASKLLLGVGVATDELVPKLKEMQDVAAVFKMPLSVIAEQTAVAKEFGFSMRQARALAMEGVPIFKELNKYVFAKTGHRYSDQQLKKFLSEGRISGKAFEGIISQMASKGGIAYKGMEQDNATLSKSFAKLKNSIERVFEETGAGLNNTFHIASWMDQSSLSVTKFSKSLGEFIDKNPNTVKNVGILVGALITIPPVLIGIGKAITVMSGMLMLNPLVLAITGIAAAIALIYANKEAIGSFVDSHSSGINAIYADKANRAAAGMSDMSLSNTLQGRENRLLGKTSKSSVDINIKDPNKRAEVISKMGNTSDFNLGYNGGAAY